MQILEARGITIKRITKGKLPGLPFVRIKNKVLGKEYDLSITFVSPQTMKALSKEHKGSADHMNILSFPLSKTEGEIIMNLGSVRKEAPKFNTPYSHHLYFLVIHGMLHLKGMTHGSKMEAEEKRLMKEFHL